MTTSGGPVTGKTFQAPAAWEGALDDGQLEALTGHVQHLLAESPEAHGYAPPDQTPTPEALHDIAKWLRANRKVDELFVPAMCCALPRGTATGRFGTHILIAALNETTRDRHHSVALHACREIRLMCLGKRPELMQRIEHAPDGPTSDVLNWVKEERSKPPPDENGASDKPPPPDRQLARLESLLERYVNNKVIERSNIDNPPRARATGGAVGRNRRRRGPNRPCLQRPDRRGCRFRQDTDRSRLRRSAGTPALTWATRTTCKGAALENRPRPHDVAVPLGRAFEP